MILLLLILIMLSGCEEIAPGNEHVTLTIDTRGHINGQMAMTINVAMVYDKDLYNALKSYTAHEFLLKKIKLISDNPDGIDVWKLDFIEYQKKTYCLPFDKNYWGVIIFIHFTDDTAGKIVLPINQHKIKIIVIDNNFSVKKDNKSYLRYKQLSSGEAIDV